jgi:CheY-like chemotaxis protein
MGEIDLKRPSRRTPMRRVLVVEDDQDVRDTVCETLEDVGYTVSTATNGLLALEALESALDAQSAPGAESTLPDLILLDLMMPVMDGERFLRELRKHPQLSALNVVLLTADSHALTQGIRLGANQGLRKPVQLSDLIATVSKYCDHR